MTLGSIRLSESRHKRPWNIGSHRYEIPGTGKFIEIGITRMVAGSRQEGEVTASVYKAYLRMG